MIDVVRAGVLKVAVLAIRAKFDPIVKTGIGAIAISCGNYFSGPDMP